MQEALWFAIPRKRKKTGAIIHHELITFEKVSFSIGSLKTRAFSTKLRGGNIFSMLSETWVYAARIQLMHIAAQV